MIVFVNNQAGQLSRMGVLFFVSTNTKFVLFDCKESTYFKSLAGSEYVNSALIYHLHSSHLQFSTPLPPPTVNLLRRLDSLNTINDFEILNISIFNFVVQLMWIHSQYYYFSILQSWCYFDLRA